MKITTEQLTVRFGDTSALDGVDLDLAAGRIVGILGRNGAGKSTLMSVVAGFRRPTAGRVLVDGAAPFEDADRMAATAVARGKVPHPDSTSVKDHLEVAALLRPRWDQPYAERLLERFDVPTDKKIGKLSKGKQCAVDVITALASRAPLTLIDEPHLGMDVPSRYAFYEELLADYVEQPRTILFATHLIEEIANLLEEVVIIDRGRVLVHEPVAELRQRGIELTGPIDEVDDITVGARVLSSRTLGRTKSVVVFGDVGALESLARQRGVDVGPIPLQDLFVHLTEPANALATHDPEQGR